MRLIVVGLGRGAGREVGQGLDDVEEMGSFLVHVADDVGVACEKRVCNCEMI